MKILYTIAFLLISSVLSFAQSEVTVSNERIKRDDIVMFVHNIKQKETLYSISKVYNVPIAEILRINPQIESGLKIGTVIYIPDRISDNQANEQKKKPLSRAEARRLRKKAKQERIANALKKKKEREMQEQNRENERDSINNAIYTVDTLYRDSANIIIADSGYPVEVYYPVVPNEPSDICMIIPLNSKGGENASSQFMDFYCGALLALNEMSRNGIDVNLTVIDQNDYRNIDEILLSGKLSEKDVIIGPVKPSEIEAVVNDTTIIGSYVVSPMDNNAKVIADSSAKFIQIPTPLEAQLVSLVDLLESEYRGENSNVVLICENSNADTMFVNTVSSLLNEKGIYFNKIEYTILQGRTIINSFKNSLREKVNNIVIVPSNKEAFISDVMRNLSILSSDGYNISLYGMPKWRNYDILDIYQKHDLKLHLSVPYYIDYSDEYTKYFVNAYKTFFNTHPTPYAFQGFDIIMYMGENLWKDKNFIRGNRMPDSQLLQSNFSFSKPDNIKGFVNCGSKNIVYNKDFTISLVK